MAKNNFGDIECLIKRNFLTFASNKKLNCVYYCRHLKVYCGYNELVVYSKNIFKLRTTYTFFVQIKIV